MKIKRLKKEKQSINYHTSASKKLVGKCLLKLSGRFKVNPVRVYLNNNKCNS